MKTFHIKEDIKIFGFQVSTFPVGVGEAFDSIAAKIGGFNRPFYGISHMTEDGHIVYIAAAEERLDDEAERFFYNRYIIEKGEYISVILRDWLKKIDSMKDIFGEFDEEPKSRPY